MRKRREEPAYDQRQRQRATTTGGRSLTVVKNVLGHRETERGHRGVDDAVNHAVKLVFLPEKEDEKNERLADLFDDRRRDHSRKSLARICVRECANNAL